MSTQPSGEPLGEPSGAESPKPYLRTDLVEEGAGVVGQGLFARGPIPCGTIIGCLTPGTPVALPIDEHGQVAYGRYASGQTLDLVVESHQLICLVKEFGPRGPQGADLINHSCTPNCEVLARLVVRTLRDIAPQEELLIDYLLSEVTMVKEGVRCQCRPGCSTII
jgi:hypothetical protein